MQYAIEISNRFKTLTYLDEDIDFEREWQELKTAVRSCNRFQEENKQTMATT